MQLNINNIGNMELENCVGNSRSDVCFFLKQRWAIQNLPEHSQMSSYFGFFANHVKKCQGKGCTILANQKAIFAALEKKDFTTINIELNQYIIYILKENSRDDDVLSTLLYTEYYKSRSIKVIENFNRNVTEFYQRFLVFHLCRLLEKDLGNEDYRVTEENFTETKLAFLKQLEATCENLSFFFDELNSKKARLTMLEEIGTHCFEQIEELKKLFFRLLDNKMDLTIVGFYLEFV